MAADMTTDNGSALFQSEEYLSGRYFDLIKRLVGKRGSLTDKYQKDIDKIYEKILEEITGNKGKPVAEVSFGTSGWRGILGKDIFCKSIAQVTLAIVEMYKNLGQNEDLAIALGVSSFEEVQKRGCVIGFDNRFAGEILAATVADVIDSEGVRIFYAGESTTGVLSAAVVQLGAAFSINLTPSHNPLEYGGFKFNAADGGPAAAEITRCITANARKIIESGRTPQCYRQTRLPLPSLGERVEIIDALALWKQMVVDNKPSHGLDYIDIIDAFERRDDVVVAIDAVHGAARLHIHEIFGKTKSPRLLLLRNEADVTFGGVAPEPSRKNMEMVVEQLRKRTEHFKIGAIIDPDGDRIRFTDGNVDISMNQFGAMAYHFLHEVKGKKGMVAKTVATSNLANSLADNFREEIFEPRVGFKEFKPVIDRALVCFEESDGITIIGHTPEKDAYIGLLLALDMVLTTGKNLGAYLQEIEKNFGAYYPVKDGVTVRQHGEKLLQTLSMLEKYQVGTAVQVGEQKKNIVEVLVIDGRKMIFEDGSWLMIRPSGTEPKVRFYVESRTADGTDKLVATAKKMLEEVGLL